MAFPSSSSTSPSPHASPSLQVHTSLPHISPSKYPDSPRTKGNDSKKVGLVALAVLMFYTVSGGAYGIEEIVKAGGPFYALIGFSLLIVWAIPEALVTAELATAVPEASGSVSWCTIAFGPKWGFIKGWLSLLSGIADNSLYPILFFDYVISLLAGLDMTSELLNDGTIRWILIAFLTLLLTYINYRGLDVVGMTAIGLCIFSLLPLLVFCVIGAFQVKPSNWLITPPGGLSGINWPLYLNTFFWNINYWESSACYAGDVHNPARNYPIALLLAILLVTLSTSIPILIGTGASTTPYSEWEDGYFTYLAVEIGGPWLGWWMMAGAMMSNIGMFEAEMSSDSWQVTFSSTSSLSTFVCDLILHRLPEWQIVGSSQRSWEHEMISVLPLTESFSLLVAC
jgi:amino acid transporter